MRLKAFDFDFLLADEEPRPRFRHRWREPLPGLPATKASASFRMSALVKITLLRADYLPEPQCRDMNPISQDAFAAEAS
jgi:hypothetical protein